MQVSIESSTGLERQLKIGVPADKIDQEVTNRLQKATKTVSIKGFRKGKVPLKVVKQHYGKGVRQEVVGEIVNSSFYEAIQQEDLKPVGQPQINDLSDKEGQDLEFMAVFEVFPEVALKPLTKVKLDRPVSEVTEADVEKMIDQLRNQQSAFKVGKKKAKDGHQVNIDYVGTRDGEEFDGGKAEGQDLVLGSSSMIPGFEKGLEGLSAGEETVLKLSFPEDYHAEELKGAAVEFAVKINSVASKVLPKMDDEFFKLFGVESGGEEKFREDKLAEWKDNNLRKGTGLSYNAWIEKGQEWVNQETRANFLNIGLRLFDRKMPMYEIIEILSELYTSCQKEFS